MQRKSGFLEVAHNWKKYKKWQKILKIMDSTELS